MLPVIVIIIIIIIKFTKRQMVEISGEVREYGLNVSVLICLYGCQTAN